jgi:hypothetical protein
VSASPFSSPIDVQVSYTTSVHVGQVFDLGFDVIAALGAQGTLDLSHTAQLSFALPDGLVLTSALGGTYGSVPEPASVALLGFGLAGLGAVARRRSDRFLGSRATPEAAMRSPIVRSERQWP